VINVIRVVQKPDNNPEEGDVLGIDIIKKARHVESGDCPTPVAKKAMIDTVLEEIP
jgi:hypothetical protein